MSPNLLSKLLLPEAAGRWSVPTGSKLVTRLAHTLGPVFSGLGRLETGLLRRKLAGWPVDRPIYVTGIARAGTTITLELIHHHRDAATHRYYHLPLPQLPHWSSKLITALPLEAVGPVERVHADRLQVTKDSPEMVEERLWMAHFRRLHSEQHSGVLSAQTHNPRFERAYRDHLRKLCFTQQRPRYAAKNNNLVGRLPYLCRLFPDARILLILRHPVAHVASLHKQQQLFTKLCAEDPSLARYLTMVGHYEFGPTLQFLNVGRPDVMQSIRALWRADRFPEAWATYWASIYGHLSEVLQRDPIVAAATQVVRYEDLCRDSGPTMDTILRHTELDAASFARTRAHYADTLTEPDYYRHGFSDAEVKAMERITATVASGFGY